MLFKNCSEFFFKNSSSFIIKKLSTFIPYRLKEKIRFARGQNWSIIDNIIALLVETMSQILKNTVLFFFTFLLISCQSDKPQTLRIAINAWPGYEALNLAKEKGFFKQVGLNVELIQVPSLADTQRAYLNHKVDALTSTLIEAIQIQSFAVRPVKIALVSDYSLGGDVIVTHKSIENLSGLKGRAVGAEVSSLGIFILQRGLQKQGMSFKDIEVKNVEQMSAVKHMENKDISAFVTYPPTSIELLKNPNYHVIFDSAQIPKEVVDVISISDSYLEKYPETLEKLWQAWQLSYQFINTNNAEAMAIMAKHEGLSVNEFTEAFANIHLLPGSEQEALISSTLLRDTTQQVCNTLSEINSINEQCEFIPSMFITKDKIQ